MIAQVEKARKSLLNESMVKEKLLKVLKDNNTLKLIIKEHNIDYHILMKQKRKVGSSNGDNMLGQSERDDHFSSNFGHWTKRIVDSSRVGINI